jgi:hypothetical protein
MVEASINFNIYLPKKTAIQLTRIAKTMRRSKSSIITEALEEWMEKHTHSRWPKGFFDFEPIDDVPDFKEMRKDFSI